MITSNITTPKNQRFSLKLRKLNGSHPDQDKLKSKKVKLESVGSLSEQSLSELPLSVQPEATRKTQPFSEALQEPPSHTEGEKADMDTKEAVDKEPTKEPKVENVEREPGITDDAEFPKKLVKASSKVRPDPDEPVRVPYEVHEKLYHLTNDEIQAHLDREEKNDESYWGSKAISNEET
ncbi:hypothetical protein Tco_0322585 [Tanacetum coccineum]